MKRRAAFVTPRPSRYQRVKWLLEELYDLRDTYPVESKLCDHCGRNSYDDFAAYQMRMALEACVSRLEKVLGEMSARPRLGSRAD